jgi:hypothetical protein
VPPRPHVGHEAAAWKPMQVPSAGVVHRGSHTHTGTSLHTLRPPLRSYLSPNRLGEHLGSCRVVDAGAGIRHSVCARAPVTAHPIHCVSGLWAGHASPNLADGASGQGPRKPLFLAVIAPNQQTARALSERARSWCACFSALLHPWSRADVWVMFGAVGPVPRGCSPHVILPPQTERSLHTRVSQTPPPRVVDAHSPTPGA